MTKHLRVNEETDAKLGEMAERLQTSKVWLGEMILSEALRAMVADSPPTSSNIVSFVREQLGMSNSKDDKLLRRIAQLEERLNGGADGKG